MNINSLLISCLYRKIEVEMLLFLAISYTNYYYNFTSSRGLEKINTSLGDHI